MSIPTDTASSLARDAAAASEFPKSTGASRASANSSAASAANASKSNLANSIQALKDLATKSGPLSAGTPPSLTGEPLVSAYEKRIQTLQDTLKERDQVVQMLTQRLEQAADQLDRFQRTGANRGSSVAAGIPPELIENQQTLVEQMSRVLGQWEEMQAGQMLARIESQITELHDLVASGTIAPSSAGAFASPLARDGNAPKVSTGASVFSDIPATEPAKTGWEAIKAAMMAGEGYAAASVTSPVRTDAKRETNVGEEKGESSLGDERRGAQTLPEPPPAIDFDIADQDQLCEAIRSRDEFISTLLRRLSSPDVSTEFPDWEKLNFVPEDLHRELLSLRDRLQEKLRVAEVDLSLQRAKLAREEARLTIKAEQVARQMRQLGLAPEESQQPQQASSGRALTEGSNATQGRRWLQFLQRSNAGGLNPE